MVALKVAFEIGDEIVKGLADGTLERLGGLIRDSSLKRVTGWVREAAGVTEPVLSPLLSITTAGTLNLAISTMGFAVVMHRLAKIERQLRKAQELLSTIDYKIDISFLANFRAALDLARSVLTMSSEETRKASLLQAVNRFLEAERHYIPLADIEVNNRSQVATEYVSTLSLAYVIAARCYLELEELETAEAHLKEGLSMVRPSYVRHVSDLLTSNPAAYLHPSLRSEIDLRRLTRIYEWVNPGADLNTVFEMQREQIFRFNETQSEWIRTLPQAIRLNKVETVRQQDKKGWLKMLEGQDWKSALRSSSSQVAEVLPRLAEVIRVIETMIEDECRFRAYIFEIEHIRQQGISFHYWKELSASSVNSGSNTGLVYIGQP
jgi:hypothetical protein